MYPVGDVGTDLGSMTSWHATMESHSKKQQTMLDLNMSSRKQQNCNINTNIRAVSRRSGFRLPGGCREEDE